MSKKLLLKISFVEDTTSPQPAGLRRSPRKLVYVSEQYQITSSKSPKLQDVVHTKPSVKESEQSPRKSHSDCILIESSEDEPSPKKLVEEQHESIVISSDPDSHLL